MFCFYIYEHLELMYTMDKLYNTLQIFKYYYFTVLLFISVCSLPHYDESIHISF